MSKNNQLPKSVKKFIRLEKARIRKQFLDVKKQEELINEIYKKFLGQTSATPTPASKEEATPVEKPKKAEVKKITKPRVKAKAIAKS